MCGALRRLCCCSRRRGARYEEAADSESDSDSDSGEPPASDAGLLSQLV